MGYLFRNAKFIKTAILPKDYPLLVDKKGKTMLEVAVAGRSNVGKSSLLNNLFNQKNLVKTSSTPGKTQALNFFTLDDKLAFVDLPGYGYAQVPLAVRKKWGPMIQSYLQERESLKLILFLMDIRRIPNDEDKQLLEWVAFQEKSLILILTKVDKVNQTEKRDNTKKILEAFDTKNIQYLHYSSQKNEGRKELMHKINEALEEEKNVVMADNPLEM